MEISDHSYLNFQTVIYTSGSLMQRHCKNLKRYKMRKTKKHTRMTGRKGIVPERLGLREY